MKKQKEDWMEKTDEVKNAEPGGRNACSVEKGQTLLQVLKGLLLSAVGMQVFLSVYDIYSAGPLNMTLRILLKIGNILNIVLVILFCVYLFFMLYIWGQRGFIIRKFREFLRVENLLFAAFLIWMYVSGWYHQSDNQDVFQDNAFFYSNALLKFLLFFLLGQYLNGTRKWLHFMFKFLVLITTSFVIYVLVTMIFHDQITLQSGGIIFFSGGEDKRLCLNSNSNITGMYAKTMLMLCIYLFVSAKKNRWLYLVAAVAHYAVLILSASRAAIGAGGVGVGAVVMLWVWRKIRSRKLCLRVLISLVTFAAVFSLFLLLRVPVAGTYNVLRKVCSGQDEISLRKMGLQSSGRMVLYKAAIQSMRDPEAALFGVTPGEVGPMLASVTGYDSTTYTHNEFLEIMCSIGIPGLIIYLGWFCCIARKGWIVCCDRNGFFSMLDGTLAIVCFTEILNNMLEARLTFFLVLSGMIFYLAAGYILTDERDAGKTMIEGAGKD